MKKKKKITSLLSKRQFANMIESYAAIVSLPTNDIKEYAKAAIRDIFIQMPSRSVTYENWPGFKQYVVGFFGEDSYNLAMEELKKEGWLTENETRYEWKKVYGPVGTVPKLLHHLNEWADVVTAEDRGQKFRVKYLSDDAYPFTYDPKEKRAVLGRNKGMHGFANVVGGIDGRIWTDKKIVSLWKYPERQSEFDDIIKAVNVELEKKQMPIINSSWRVDVPKTGLNIYELQNDYREFESELQDEHENDQTFGGELRDVESILVPINQWKPSIMKNPLEWKKNIEDRRELHTMSPLEKAKRGVKIHAPGFGSEKRFKVKDLSKVGKAYSQGDIPQHVAHQMKYTSDSVIKNKPILENESNDDYKKYIPQLTKFMVEKGMKIIPFPKVKVVPDAVENSESIFGKTAHYDRENKCITLFTLDRHPKDILRSFAHEMVHHEQNLNGELNNIMTTNTNEDGHMEEFEKEAYEKGNIMLRNWEDSIKQNVNEQKLNEMQNTYGCLMLKIDFPNWDKFVDKYIDENDLYDNAAHDFGREHEPHITILYGFHDDANVEKIKEIVQLLKNEITVTTTVINTFSTNKFDVVKFKMKSPMLIKLNEIMRKNFKYTSNFPNYSPHMTIGYVKPGLGEKYVKNLGKTLSFTSGTFIYSYPGGGKEEFSIKKNE